MSQDESEKLNPLITTYHPLHAEDFPLILFWSPKSGCTTLTKWFFFQVGLLHDVQQQTGGKVHNYRYHIYSNKPGYTSELRKSLLERTKATYKLVRNPYKRTVSSFLSTICSPWLISMLDSEMDKGLSFLQFLYRLKELGPDIQAIDRHIGPQYIPGEECFVKNYIGLENFNAQIRSIEKQYRLLKAPLAKITKSPHHFSRLMTEEGNFAEMRLTATSFDHFFPTYESFYNHETKGLVREIFMKDFETYGYDPDDSNFIKMKKENPS